jgi:uncharacterized protein YndB with AHSA1/START domain
VRSVIEIDREVVIARQSSVVFDYLADVGNYPRWQPAIERAEQVTPGTPGLGTRVRLILRGPTGPTEVLGEIVAFDRPAGLAIRSLTGPAEIEARCGLDAAGADGVGTRLRLTASIELKGFLRFAEGHARTLINRELPTVLADLAKRIESEA